MKAGKVENYINDKIEKEGALLLTLMDPDKIAQEKCGNAAKVFEESGADVILVGGTIGVQGGVLDEAVKAIKENVSIPVVIFSGNVGAVTKYADALYFMFLINSRDNYWNSTEQIRGAPVARKAGLECIPTGYVIIEPGMAVGWITNANLVPRYRPDLAAASALAGEYMGARLIITDSGSGAPEPAPTQLVKAVKSVLTVPYFYAGGVRKPEQATEIIKAGADGIHIGTAFELDGNSDRIRSMADAVKRAGKEKV